MADVFLSHSHHDAHRAARLAEALTLSGLSVWWDRSIGPGWFFRKTIEQELNAARHVIVLWTRKSIHAPWVLDEAELALKQNKLVPVLLEDVHPPLGMRQIQAHDLRGWDGRKDSPDLRDLIEFILQQKDSRSFAKKDIPDQVTIADSTLFVIRAITQYWGIEKIIDKYGLSSAYTLYPWDDSLLHDMVTGRIDIAIYNTNRSRQFLDAAGAENFRIVRSAGHSMGGKNFFILAHKDSKWNRLSYKSIKEDLAGAVIGVPRNSDMLQNFFMIMGIDGSSCDELNVTIIDIPVTMGMEFYRIVPDGLLITGQNVRFASLARGGCKEVFNFHDLPQELQDYFYGSSSNSMLASNKLIDLLGEQNTISAFHEAWHNFQKAWHDDQLYQAGVDHMVRTTFSGDFLDHEISYAIRKILYETYRFGEPI